MITEVEKVKVGMDDVYTFLKNKKANLENEVRQEVAERENVINEAISAITYKEMVEVDDETEDGEEENY